MADYDINSPNDFVDSPPNYQSPMDSDPAMPPSAIGKGGLSAIAIAGRGSPSAPNLGGLVTGGGQQSLEDKLFSRVRSQDQLATDKATRLGGLNSLQQALAAPENNYTGIENIARGMANNDHPWDVGHGFQKGVAAAMDADLAAQKLKRDSGIESATARMKFDTGEEKIDDSVESNALNNLRGLAKPVRGLAGGAGGGVRFKNVPGTGLVDTWNVDQTGVPNVVYPDGARLTEMRKLATTIAEKQAESEQNNVAFESDAARRDFIRTRADQITADLVAGTKMGGMKSSAGAASDAAPATDPGTPATDTPITTSRLKVKGPINTGGSVPSVSYPNTAYNFTALTNADFNKLHPEQQLDLKASMAAAGKDTSMFEPANASGLADDGTLKIVGPEVQKGRIKTSEKVAEEQAKFVAENLKPKMQTGLDMQSTVDELRQLKFNPGMFAKWKQTGGNLLEAFGVDGPIQKMAAQSGNAESLLQALSNARISLEKGVQTKDDEIRFKNELAKITDPKAAYDYMLTHMKELGQKSIDQYNTYENFRKNNGNSYDGADQAWQKANDDRGGMVKKYQGGFIGRTEFINNAISDPANVKAYNGDTNALRARAEKEWKKLGGN